jgi:hypothetical protein
MNPEKERNMRLSRAAALVAAVLWIVGSAPPVAACPLCGRGEVEGERRTGSPPTAFAMAGLFLLSMPFALAGAYGLMLHRTLSSSGTLASSAPSAAKDTE